MVIFILEKETSSSELCVQLPKSTVKHRAQRDLLGPHGRSSGGHKTWVMPAREWPASGDEWVCGGGGHGVTDLTGDRSLGRAFLHSGSLTLIFDNLFLWLKKKSKMCTMKNLSHPCNHKY